MFIQLNKFDAKCLHACSVPPNPADLLTGVSWLYLAQLPVQLLLYK